MKPRSGNCLFNVQIDEPMQDATTQNQLLIRWLFVISVTWGAFELTSLAGGNNQHSLDVRVLQFLRSNDDLSRVAGPRFLGEAMRDMTGLGGYAVLIGVTAAVSFVLRRVAPSHQRFYLLTVLGGYGCSMLMKFVVGRTRPDVVPHLAHVSSSSFPSSHAMMSIIVYPAAGLLMSRLSVLRPVQTFVRVGPLALAILIGVTRVFLGVHYPTDVFAGWVAGLLWLWAAFAFRERLKLRNVDAIGEIGSSSTSG
ncbi:MAG: phosphatase PAP2 family protein [Planctomycetaceae bacterium]|nr:phosphatase PAP2 family protein [Planctomycetaceae bacterium]